MILSPPMKLNSGQDSIMEFVDMQHCSISWPGPDRMEIHAYSDASRNSISCVVYLHVLKGKDVHVAIVLGKTHITSNKRVYIPHLEVIAAEILVLLLIMIKILLEIKINGVTLWIDATYMLHYFKKNTELRPVLFVANQLERIHELLDPSEWRYVPTYKKTSRQEITGFDPG